MRDYVLMRQILAEALDHKQSDGVKQFFDLADSRLVEAELDRLSSEGLLEASLEYDSFGTCVGCGIGGLTSEGVAFYRLVENGDVWRIVHSTLMAVNVDISYPLLKEVCEEIVKRYVASFIPDIPSK